MNVREDTLQGLREALDYVKGDKTKGRSVIVEVSDDEIEFYNMYKKLSEKNKEKAKSYINDLFRI